MSQLADFRKSKDQFFAADAESPLMADQIREFTGLSYYDENAALRLELDVQEFDDKEVVEMQTSTGGEAT